MNKLFASDLGSAGAARADCGASPRTTDLSDEAESIVSQKPALAGTLVRFAALLLSACALFACETSNYAPQVKSTSKNASQVDRGRTLFVHRCIECHTLPPIWKYSREDWPQIVNDMSHRANLKPEDREAVIAYILTVRSQE